MARAGVPDTKTKLLEGTVNYILRHGLTDLTLRPLAAALKTSPRMLIYFFGSKEQLITEALARARVRQQQELARLVSTEGTRGERLAMAWDVWSSEANTRYAWFFFEVYALAMRNRKRFPGFLERLVKGWLPFFEEAVAGAGVEPERRLPLATFISATIRGLHLDLLATGEKTRIDSAFEEMLHLLSLPRLDANKSPRQTVNSRKRLG
jgi:AcrR family transcriptional regulator